tara:strand:+ start:497 stop:1006 length:510 start_codon:yes stop_codon:yes gene_type:complete
LRIEFEDSFIKVAAIIGGDDYIKISRAILNNNDSTEEEIASATGLKINTVRKTLYDLFGRALITGVRVRDMKKGWFVYRWRAQQEQVSGLITSLKRKSVVRLKAKLEHEESHQFYACNSPGCIKESFEKSLEYLFLCPQCGNPLKIFDNTLIKDSIKWKISQIESELVK